MRGGFIGKLIKDQFLYTGLENTRAYRELSLLDAMYQRGLPVPRPVAAQVVKAGMHYRADFLTGLISDSTDLLTWLIHKPLPENLWYDVGKAIASLHLAQVYHHDLNIKNLMIDAANKIWIIDFDRCRFKQGEQWKMHNIARLERSLHKQARLQPSFHFSPPDWRRLLDGYFAFSNDTRSPRASI
jgi:3-deoxy-D-manno-octulosonic acid kinase